VVEDKDGGIPMPKQDDPKQPGKASELKAGGVYRILKGGVVADRGSGRIYYVEPGGVLKISRGPHAVIVRKGGSVLLNGGGAYVYMEKGADVKEDGTFANRIVYDTITFAAAPLRPFTLSGRVTDAKGGPAAGVKVHAFGLGREHLGTRTTEADGTFAFSPRREVVYLAADLGPRWAKEVQPAHWYGVDQRLRNRVLKDWEAVVTEGSWAKDAEVALVHSNRDTLEVRELGSLPRALEHSFLGGIVFAPGRGQSQLLAVAGGRQVHLWDLKEGKQRRQLLEVKQTPGKFQMIKALVFASDGATLAAAGPDKVVRLWRTATGEKLRELEFKGEVGALRFTPDGKHLLTGGDDGVVITWDVATGREVRRFKAHQADLQALVFSPDGKTLLTAGNIILTGDMLTLHQLDLLRVWDVASGSELRKFSGAATGLAFSPDSSLLVTAGTLQKHDSPAPRVFRSMNYNEVKLRSTLTGAELMQLPSSGTQAVFSPDGRLLVTVGYGGEVQFWEVATGQQVLRVPLPQTGGAPAAALAPGGGRVAAAETYSGTVTVWDLDWESLHALQPLKAPNAADRDKLWAALATPDGAEAYRAIRALTAGRDDTVAFLRERLRPAPVKDLPFARLIDELNSNRFTVRQAASAALAKIGTEAEPALRQALAGERPLEARRRIEGVLADLQRAKLTAEGLRQLRAVAVLERIGSAEARKLVEALAGGWLAARQTREAQATLRRLTRP
jgi:WD40 repeat protein